MAIVLPKEFQMETVLEQEQEIGFGISISKRSSNSSSLISAVTSAYSNLGLCSVRQTSILPARTWRMEGKTLQYRRKCVQHVQLGNGLEKTVLKVKYALRKAPVASRSEYCDFSPPPSLSFWDIGNFSTWIPVNLNKRWDL